MLGVEMISNRIQESYPDAIVTPRDLTGGGDHWEVTVVTQAFEGKRLLQQHKLIYACFKVELASGELHALALKTFTPKQWETR